jgi:phospholipid/cholesterol/gamma-HCH transport system substrate-binding protein
MQHKPRISPFSLGLAVVAAMLVIVSVIVVSGIPGGPKVGLPWDHTYTVKAQLSDADALAPKAGVQIAGVKIGEVRNVDLHGTTALVTMELYPQYSDIHSDARVLLRPHGLFGPKYIELQPGTSTAPLLHDGDTIPGAQAVLPVDLDQILHELQAPEQQQLKTAIVELGKAAAGRGTDFNELVQAGNTLSQVLDQPLKSLDGVSTNLSDMFVKDEAFNASFAQTPLDKLVEASNVSLAAFAQTSSQLGDLLDHANSTLTNLDASLNGESGNIRAFLEKAPGVIDQLTTFNNQLGTFAGALTGADSGVTSKSLLFDGGLDAAIENPWSALSSYDGNCTYDPTNPDKPTTTSTGAPIFCSPDGHFHYFKVQTFTAANQPSSSPASMLLPTPQNATAAGFLSDGSGFSASDLTAFGDLIGS